MKKFLDIFIAMVLIGCSKSDNTEKNQNNSTKQSIDSNELIEKNITADSKPSENDNTNVQTKSDENSDNGVYAEMETSKADADSPGEADTLPFGIFSQVDCKICI